MNKYFKKKTPRAYIQPVGIFCLIVMTTVIYSCKSKRAITEPKNRCDAELRGAKWLTSNLKQNEFHFNTFDSKINVESLIDSTENSFVVTVRMKKDSIIWISVSKLGIEAVRMFITTDTVSLVNRINKEYFKGDFAYLSELLNTQLDFEILQSLLVGNSVTFYDDEEKIKANINYADCEYLLGTIRKHKLKKVMVKGKELKEPAQSIYMDTKSFKIKRILFYDFNLNRSFDATFSAFEKVDSTQLLPSQIKFSIKAQKNIFISLQYVKYKLNEEVSFSFKIPENYEPINYKEK